jgi:hypothetical protein
MKMKKYTISEPEIQHKRLFGLQYEPVSGKGLSLANSNWWIIL